MNFQMIKQQVCRFLMSAMGFLLLVIFCAAVEGTVFWPVALLLGLADLVGMNFLCGLAESKPAPKTQSAPVRTSCAAGTRRAVSLRVVRGGRAA